MIATAQRDSYDKSKITSAVPRVWAAVSLTLVSTLHLASADAAAPTSTPPIPGMPTPNQARLAGYWSGDLPTIKEIGKIQLLGPAAAGFGVPKALDELLQPAAKEAMKSGPHSGPDPGGGCSPYSIPAVNSGAGLNMQLLLAPEVAVILYEEDHNARIIYMNGGHPPALMPSRAGHSIGHWEGDTLVVDTVGFDPAYGAYMGRISASSNAHVIERFNVSEDGSRLEATVTYDDPSIFKAPYTSSGVFKRGEYFQEYVTAENNRLGCPTAESGNPNRAPD